MFFSMTDQRVSVAISGLIDLWFIDVGYKWDFSVTQYAFQIIYI